MSVLDLPLDRQKQIAKEVGFGDDVEAWREEMRRDDEETQTFLGSLEAVRYSDLTPEEKETHDHWQKKVDSGNPIAK